jgi:hypothetical protein
MAHAITTTMTNTVIVLQIQVLTLIWLRNLIDSSFGPFRSLSMVEIVHGVSLNIVRF